MAQVCWKCGEELSPHHTGYICDACQDKMLKKMAADSVDLVDTQGYADMLGLDSIEQLKRLARMGVLAPNLPDIKQWLWRRKDIETRIKQRQREGNAFRKTAMGIASNLMTCRNDSVICLGPSDKVGSKVYGQENVFGTTDVGRVEPITLVKINKSVALKMLEQLPKKGFPELTDITDWADLTYDKINKDLATRLEAYF